tara:strand:+ start:117 stop:461 length:345 start_codon:yes stop_codon:yes gene_type:complete
MTADVLNEELKYFLQRNISFSTTTRVFKKGRMVLFNIGEYYISFTVETAFSNKLQSYEIPYPFAVEKAEEGKLHLDYRFNRLYNNSADVRVALANEKIECKSKYLDTVVTLKTI